MAQEGFPDLPVEVSESILSRIDFPEINQLKYLSRQFKSLIKSNPFSEVYDNRAESSASNWLIAHAIFQPESKAGVLYCIRESDSMTKIIDLGRLLQGRIEPEGEIWLLSVQNSLVLLRYFNPPKVLNLFVINIGTNQIHVINVPEIIDGHYLNVDTANFVFEPRATVMNDITYKIVTAEFGEDEILRHFRYTSANGNDQWHVSHARLLEAQENIHPDGGNDDLIRASDLGMLLVSTRLGESIYKCPPTDELTELTFSLAFSMFTLDDLKRSIVETYFGLDGWAILLVRRTDRGNDELTRVAKISLFQINEDWTSYQHVSTTPKDKISPNIFFFDGQCYVQQVGTKVNITLVTQHHAYDSDDFDYAFYSDDDDDSGPFPWMLHKYTFDTAISKWCHRAIPIYDAVDIWNVVYTAKLTLGRTA